MNKEEITAWRVIYQILKETGYDKLYEEEITCVVNALWKLKELADYKERNEKAIEYIKEIQNFPHTNQNQHRDCKELIEILDKKDKE